MKFGIVHCKQIRPNALELVKRELFEHDELGKNFTSPNQVLDLIDCGGCPGTKLVGKIQGLLDNGAQGVALAACITGNNNTPHPCNNYPNLKKELDSIFGERISYVLRDF